MMALPLLDLALASGNGRSAAVASQLIRSALLDLEQIEQLETSLFPVEPLAFDRPSAALVRGLFERWVQEAEALLERIRDIERRSVPMPDAEALRHAHGRTRARLSVSLDDLEQGLNEALTGDTVPAEEVRRELRLRVHSKGSEGISSTRTVAGGGSA